MADVQTMLNWWDGLPDFKQEELCEKHTGKFMKWSPRMLRSATSKLRLAYEDAKDWEFTFKDAYQLPINTCPYSGIYAYSKNQTTALSIDSSQFGNPDIKTCLDYICSAINGEEVSLPWDSFEQRYGSFYFNGSEEPFFHIRGWGALHGTGGFHLPIEKAEKVQDDFIAFVEKAIANKINQD